MEREGESIVIQRATFPLEYLGRPAEVHDALQRVHLETPFAVIHGRTDYGGPRSKYKIENQDSMFAGSCGDVAVAGVVDGAGGSDGGLLASSTATDVLPLDLLTGRSTVEALGHAHEEILTDLAEQRHGRIGAAVAVVVRLHRDGRVELACLGDAKAVTVRRGVVVPEATTVEQNWGRWAVFAGKLEPHQYYASKYAAHLMSYLGSLSDDPWAKSNPPLVMEAELESGDQVILGSDGLWGVVSEHEAAELAKTEHGQELADSLFQLAYGRSQQRVVRIQHDPDHAVSFELTWGGDNITVLVIDVRRRLRRR